MAYIYYDGKKFEVDEEVKRELNRMTSRVHYLQRLVGQCAAGQRGMSRCDGDCPMCSYYLPKKESVEELGVRMDTMLADRVWYDPESEARCAELLDMMQKIDPDGERIGRCWMDGLRDADIIQMLGVPASTYRYRKARLKKRMRAKLDGYYD